MIAKDALRAITQAPYPRAMTALIAAALAVLIDPVFRFSDYRALPDSLAVVGAVEFSGALTLVFLQVVALFYLVALLPRPLRMVALLLSVFVVVLQFSYWQTLAQFMTGTDMFLALTVGGDHRSEAVSSFLNPLVFLCALPYVLVFSILVPRPSEVHLPKVPRPQHPAGTLPPRFQLRPLPPRAGTEFPSESPDLLPPFNTSVRV